MMNIQIQKGVSGHLICPSKDSIDCKVLRNHVVTTHNDGFIKEVSPSQNEVNSELIWLPGFVDTHVHYPQHRVRARSSGQLLPWLNQTIFPEEQRFRNDEYADIVADEFCSALLSHGTTCAQIYSSSHETATDSLFRHLHQRGLRAHVGMTLMDQGAPDELCVPTELAKAGMERLVTRWHEVDNGRLRYVVTPRFALSCSPAMLEMAGRYAQEHALAIQTHLSENQAEIEAVRQTFPTISDYLGVYESFHLLKESSLFAHCIHLTDDEWARIADAGGAISHCPDSNFFLGSGVFPWQKASHHKVPIRLGSDVGAGRTYDMRKIASRAYDASLLSGERQTPSELIWYATRGGAQCLDRPDIGVIAPGYRCDLVGLSVPNVNQMSDEALLDAIIFRADEFPVQCVITDGQTRWGNAAD